MDRRSRIRNQRLSRTQRLKNQKYKRRRLTLILILLSVVIVILTNILYVKTKCKDLQYAVEYNFTSSKASKSLLRVQNISLIFNDNKNAIVEATGLSKEEPHTSTKIRGTFKKDLFDSWILENSEKL